MRASVALRLGRVSNLPTVWSNALAGAVLASGAPDPGLLFALGLGFSASYAAGMFLNDAFDASFDRTHRPERPIPSGEISARAVFGGGFALLAAGFAITTAAGVAGAGGYRAALAAGGLAAAIVFYDAWHKDNPFGPVIMGLCRALVYITAGLAASGAVGGTLPAAGATFCYLVGLTYIAKQEVSGSLSNLWPLTLLSAPLWFALSRGSGGVAEVILCLAFVLWVVYALSFLRPPTQAIGTAVNMLISGISLVDAIFIGTRHEPALVGVVLVCFVAALFLQRRVPGT
jgi:UbiA prenyltransferase family